MNLPEKKFLAFVESLKTENNAVVVETVKQGFNVLIESATVSYSYQGMPVEVVSKNGMDEEGSTEIWTVKTQDGKTLDVKSRDLKMATPTEPTKLFDADSAASVREKLFTEIRAPYSSTQVSKLGGAENVSILLSISLQPKDQWVNGIFQNSPFANFHIYNNGIVEQFTMSMLDKKFRKCRVKSVEDLISRLNAYIETVKPVSR